MLMLVKQVPPQAPQLPVQAGKALLVKGATVAKKLGQVLTIA